MSGTYIIFEGIDGSGKGTQIELLKNKLLTHFPAGQIVLTKEPGDTQLGLELRQILFHTVTTKNMAPHVVDALFLADHIQTAFEKVRPAMDNNKIVISDRSLHSQMAYWTQREKSFNLEQAWHELRGPLPDLLFLLVGDPEVLMNRANRRTTETHQQGKKWNKIEQLEAIQRAYIDQLKLLPFVEMVPVDRLPAEEIFHLYIWPAVARHLHLLSQTTYDYGQTIQA